MQWTMPPRVLQLVAGLIGLVAIAAFVMGIVSAPGRSRLPGERPTAHGVAAGPAIQAEEATPLSDERIEGPPPPPELTPEQKAKIEAEKKAKADAEAAENAAADQTPEAAATAANPTAPKPATPQAGDRVGDLLDGVTPQPADEPPH